MTPPPDPPARRARRRAVARIAGLLGTIVLLRVIAGAVPYRRCEGGWTRVDTTESCGACGVRCGADHASASCVAGRCVLACEAHHADCDGHPGNGCEADLRVDRARCGLCTRSCDGAFCEEGQCTARLFAHGAAIAVDERAVYALWAGVTKYPLDGGDPTALAEGDGLPDEARISPFAIEIRDGRARWAVPRKRAVSSVALGGGPVIEAPAGPEDARLFAPAEEPIRLVDGEDVYRVDAPPGGGSAVKRVSPDGGEAVIVAHPHAIRSLAQNRSHLFWVDGRYRIFMAPKRPR